MVYSCELRSIDPARNRFRRYLVDVQPNLFGWTLRTGRGRIGKPLRMREKHFEDLEILQRELGALLARRVRHGYVWV